MDLRRDYPHIMPASSSAAASAAAADRAAADMPELTVLRERVEQQAELILLLQRRADDAVQGHSAAESEVETLRAAATVTDRRLQHTVEERDRLRAQFDTLSHNHREIIAFKDEHKRTSTALRARNSQLEAQAEAQAQREAEAVAAARAPLEAELAALRAELAEVRAQLAEARRAADKMRADLEQQLAATTRELDDLQRAQRGHSGRADEATRAASALQADVASYRTQLQAATEDARVANQRAETAEAALESAKKVCFVDARARSEAIGSLYSSLTLRE